jgi:hypothetical protein
MSGPWDADLRRVENEVKQGLMYIAGTLTLATSGTTTTITRDGVSASSVISLTPYDAGAKAEGIPQCVPANGSFVLTHSATATARNYRYVVHTPQ